LLIADYIYLFYSRKMPRPFFSIVTISYNQAPFLRTCVESVLSQDLCDLEYLIQDPGSTDGSREIISSFASNLNASFEADEGPADGLNKAFAKAKGRYFLFLNSDDMLMPNALSRLHKWILLDHCQHDVYSGSCSVVDASGRHLRYAYSDSMNLQMAAYGQCILIQPSSAINAEAFRAVNGFNASNHSNWDGELFIDIALKGFKFINSKHVFSCSRIHAGSITGSGSRFAQQQADRLRLFTKITSKASSHISPMRKKYFWLKRKLMNPLDTKERILRGPIFGTCK
jgi:glycosyltransferase involved in cell wall biosynthesis